MGGIAIVFTALALATTIATDGNDVSGKLDLKTAKVVRNEPLIRLTIGTWDAWQSKILVGKPGPAGPLAGRNQLTVLYDVNGDGVADFRGRIVYRKGLFVWITGRGNAYEPVPVARPNARTATFTHAADIFFKQPTGTKRLGLAVTSLYRDAGACVRACRDRLPNRGWIPVVLHFPRPG